MSDSKKGEISNKRSTKIYNRTRMVSLYIYIKDCGAYLKELTKEVIRINLN